MGGRPFPSERGTPELQNNFHHEIKKGASGPEMLDEQKIGSSPNFFSIKAVHLDPCLTEEQKRKARGSEGLSVIGLNVKGKKWMKLQLQEKNGTYHFGGETNKMIVANGWKKGTPICIWGAPGATFRDGKVRFLFTSGM